MPHKTYPAANSGAETPKIAPATAKTVLSKNAQIVPGHNKCMKITKKFFFTMLSNLAAWPFGKHAYITGREISATNLHQKPSCHPNLCVRNYNYKKNDTFSGVFPLNLIEHFMNLCPYLYCHIFSFPYSAGNVVLQHSCEQHIQNYA